MQNREALAELARRELARRHYSEYLAYAYGGEADGPAAYRTALRANPDILVPIPDGRMETELGRRVEAELKAPEPKVPEVLRELYSPLRAFRPAPRTPEPYDTFANTFTYGAEGGGNE